MAAVLSRRLDDQRSDARVSTNGTARNTKRLSGPAPGVLGAPAYGCDKRTAPEALILSRSGSPHWRFAPQRQAATTLIRAVLRELSPNFLRRSCERTGLAGP